jgi:hypothetical protein
MTTVRIVKSWANPPLNRQTPQESGEWDGVYFTESAQEHCDYLIVINHFASPITAQVPATNVWHMTQEPPVALRAYTRPTSPHFYCYFTPSTTEKSPLVVPTHTALPWHINRTYDQLKSASPIDKTNGLSWITSNLAHMSGHRQRLAFLRALQKKVDFDLWGRGFTPIDDKWDGIAPYRYALAIENYSGMHYWSEKLADCFLAWTMPIYYGATNITDYFPAESLIIIDITRPREAIEIIREAIASDRYIKHREAIAYARELILEKYQFFPFIVSHIRQWESQQTISAPTHITIEPPPPMPEATPTAWQKILYKVRRKLRQLYG